MQYSKFALAAALAAAVPLSQASAATETVLYSATGGGGFANGTGIARPMTDMIVDPSGALFGTTNFGGNGCGSNGVGCGTAFMISPKTPGSTKYQLKVLTSFNDVADGGYPMAGLTPGSNGIFYGTVSGGGSGVASSGGGLVYQLAPPAPGKTNWKRTNIYTFSGPTDGATPEGKVLLDASGALYGTTQRGGTSNNGTVFKLTPPTGGGTQWTETVLYRFAGGDDGSQPQGNLVMDAAGALYGTTSIGGNTNNPQGTVFKLTPPAVGQTAWTESVIYRFTGGQDGAFPAFSNLARDANGVLYGTTFAAGGAHNAGTVFALTPPAPGKTAWKESVLHRFTGNDGMNPNSGVVLDGAGNLYGTALNGGSATFGNVFKLAPPPAGLTAWTFSKLHDFTAGADGSNPWSTLTVTRDGVVFGTTTQGGNGCPNLTPNGCGIVFQIVQ